MSLLKKRSCRNKGSHPAENVQSDVGVPDDCGTAIVRTAVCLALNHQPPGVAASGPIAFADEDDDPNLHLAIFESTPEVRVLPSACI
jgi:hypothetical protein